MQVGPLHRPRFAALILLVLMVSGCGQKGPLYRDGVVPAAEPASAANQPGQLETATENEAPPQR
ncbi:LPS translocon maturation chaperone LptM [Marinobacter halophilus]|uniref:Lipoprotein n=1 Tax=Marinobacter halophilus TaxID=1323740 RepID=A0A2T1KJZ1_9GAMM|nr:lipoprotein [Marinobacter halophilus]PSF10330.1 hypothetical protein C7H08_02210 [Marinobacter halophilus]